MFFTPQFVQIKVQMRQKYHHWHPNSESYATVSQLYSAVLNGWQTNQLVICRQIPFARGTRHTRLYYFELKRGDDYMTMPILENPALARLLAIEPFNQVAYREVVATNRAVGGHVVAIGD